MSLVIDLKVVPSSGKQEIILDKSGQLKIFLKSEPENNKANIELIKFLSKKLDLLDNDIKILTGLNSRKKKIKINVEINFENLLKKFNLKG